MYYKTDKGIYLIRNIEKDRGKYSEYNVYIYLYGRKNLIRHFETEIERDKFYNDLLLTIIDNNSIISIDSDNKIKDLTYKDINNKE